MKKYTFYPGCSLEISNKPYYKSVKEVFNALDSEVNDLEDWNCCGATLYMGIDETRAVYLSARNLALAEKENLDLINACSACFTTLKKAKYYMDSNINLKNKVNELLKEENLQYTGKINIRHILEVIYNDFGENIKKYVKKELKGIKIACYYGCEIIRPKNNFDDTEYPEKMDELIRWAGGETVFFSHKAKCCGGMLMTTKENVAQNMVKNILLSAKNAGADIIITACPLCQMNLEGYQNKISKKFKKDLSIPILYFTQILGYAFGIEKEKLGINENFINSDKVLTNI